MSSFGALVLIPGIGLLILSTSTRFIHVSTLLWSHGASSKRSLHLRRRGRLLHQALAALYLALALFVFSALPVEVLGLETQVWRLVADGLFLVALACLSAASIWLVRESFLARYAIEAAFES